MRRPRTKEDINEYMTRQEFMLMPVDEIDLPIKIKSYGYAKWLITSADGEEELPKPFVTRHFFAKTGETDLPKQMTIKVNRKPTFVVKEL